MITEKSNFVGKKDPEFSLRSKEEDSKREKRRCANESMKLIVYQCDYSQTAHKTRLIFFEQSCYNLLFRHKHTARIYLVGSEYANLLLSVVMQHLLKTKKKNQ